MKYKKQRGQKRKLKSLINNINQIIPFEDTSARQEHFHVPSGQFISSPKTSGKIKTAFCRTWLDKASQIIANKPTGIPFCKVVALIDTADLWESQIIIFYDELYYESFWTRNRQGQSWTLIDDPEISFVKDRNLQTNLKERGYLETIDDCDVHRTSALWFYGDV